MSKITDFFGGVWSHFSGGVTAVVHTAVNFLHPVAVDIAHLTADQLSNLAVTTGNALTASIEEAQAAGKDIHAIDVLHQAGHKVQAALPAIGISLTAEAIQAAVATVSSARKQSTQDAPPPPIEAPKEEAAGASTAAGEGSGTTT